MPISINGNGTITGISTGGLPDGCVDTDTIANNAVTSTKSSGLQRRISTTVTAPTGADNITHTITAGVKKIDVILSNVSSASNSNMELQLGDSGGIETSGYNNAMGFHRTGGSGQEATVSNSTGSFATYGLDSAGYNLWGYFKLYNPTGNTWNAEHVFWGDEATNHQFFGNGYKELSGTMTQIKLKTNSGNFDSGVVTIVETMGDS